MALSSQTGSILQNADGTNRTGTALSTNIVIRVGANAIGAVQELTVTEDRSIAMINEVGTDGHIDSAPDKSTNISGTCRRIRFDRLRVSEAFSRGFVHVASQRVPFDITIYDKWNGDGDSAIITTIKNVWIKSISYTYSAGDFIITENMSWEAETIYSTISGSQPAATGGERGLPLALNEIERSTDIGGRRGSLDAPGLLTAFTTAV